MSKRKPLPTYRIAHRVVRISEGADGTTWPWPFGEDHQHPSWKARYAPSTLTQTDLYELASIANAYTTLITHPCRSVRETLHTLHRIHEAESREDTAGREEGEG